MTWTEAALLSTLRRLPDGERAEVERELVPILRAAALGDLSADVAHDVANPLFGVLGLVELLLDDTTPGSEDETRLRLLHQTALEMKRTLQRVLDFARSGDADGIGADTERSARTALGLLRHGIGKTLAIDETYVPATVACSEAELVQALLHLLLAARGSGAISLDVNGPTVSIAPAQDSSLGVAVAARIAADCGGSLSLDDGAYVLRLPRAE
jgi:signal transduction histidine kinase